MKEREGDLELINPCGRIPLIFQCTLGSGELPNWGLEIPCAIGRFKFHTCLKPSLPQELRELYYSKLKIPESWFFFLSLKVGRKKGQNWMISGWNWVCLGNAENSKSQCCVPKPAAMRWHLEAHTGLSTLSQHLVDVYPLFPFRSAALWDQLPLQWLAEGNSKGRSGNTGGIQVIHAHPHVIYCICSHLAASREENTRNQELMFWIPQAPSFVSMIRKSPTPPPQNKFTGIRGIL